MSNFRSILPENRDSSLQDSRERRLNKIESGRRTTESRDSGSYTRRSDSHRTEKRSHRESYANNAGVKYNRKRPANYGRESSKNNIFTKFLKKFPVPPVAILFVLVIVPLFVAMFTLIGKLNNVNKELETQKTEKQRLEASIESLKSELEKVNTDEFIERYAHEKLGMIKQNEIVYDVNKKSSSESSESSESSSDRQNQVEEAPETSPEEYGAVEEYNTNYEVPAEENEVDNAGQ